MLTAAGLSFQVVPSDVDEAAIRDALLSTDADSGPEDVAEILAVAKAEAVSGEHPDAWVIGSDQVLALGRDMIEKAKNREEARARLERLRGKSHHLHSAAALAWGGRAVWSHVETADLKMRPFSPEFLTQYLDQAGDAILGSVGCYHFEGVGVQLFESVAGDHYTILGMPLLPLLSALREQGAIVS
jgi:septum formation protein